MRPSSLEESGGAKSGGIGRNSRCHCLDFVGGSRQIVTHDKNTTSPVSEIEHPFA